jgi:hypothetical protein
MTKARSKSKQDGKSNHKYVPTTDNDHAEAAEDDAEAVAGSEVDVTVTTAPTMKSAPATTSYSDDEGNVIIEQYSQPYSAVAAANAAPVSPIPEESEPASESALEPAPALETASEPASEPAQALETASETASTSAQTCEVVTATFDVTIDTSRSEINSTQSTPLKRTGVCGAICNCFRALFKVCCCCCCCCCRRGRTNTTTPSTPQ